jgi:hypothetical protein
MWGWLNTKYGIRMLKGLTIGTLATVVGLLAVWSGATFGYATLSERVERSREDIADLQKTYKEQTTILYRIDNSLSVVGARLDATARAMSQYACK